ncbi:Cytochrome P450 monooxygenase BOT1 [Fusarium oxysporum f. sp. albedinis]|nr:Cytochrome P450 monooxygenase BOT1 [Fusarium oxysporum f. sp. albedinis]
MSFRACRSKSVSHAPMGGGILWRSSLCGLPTDGGLCLEHTGLVRLDGAGWVRLWLLPFRHALKVHQIYHQDFSKPRQNAATCPTCHRPTEAMYEAMTIDKTSHDVH